MLKNTFETGTPAGDASELPTPIIVNIPEAPTESHDTPQDADAASQDTNITASTADFLLQDTNVTAGAQDSVFQNVDLPAPATDSAFQSAEDDAPGFIPNPVGPIRRAAELEQRQRGAHNFAFTYGNRGAAEASLPESEPAPRREFSGLIRDFAAARPSLAMQQVISREDQELVQAQVALSKQYMKRRQYDQALALLCQAEASGPPTRDVHRLLGEIYFVLEQWEESLRYWFKTATLTKRSEQSMLRRIGLKVMRCNAQLSVQALRQGNKILAAERLAQAIEAIDFSVYVKIRKDMVEAITAYILDEIGKTCPKPAPRSEKPKRIAIVLDVIKVSQVHTHKHLYLSLAAAMAALDPDITVDLIATFERQLTWNAGCEEYYKPSNHKILEDFIHEVVPEDIASRLKVHYLESFGLRGLIGTCRDILAMNHDIILYGSGKRGFHGNESLLVRHVLYPYTPTGFFFVQSNNEVDGVNDMIIARGRHPIEGEPGDVRIVYQPYPPFPGLQAAWVPDGHEDGVSSGIRIVTAWVGVRLDKTLNAYSEEDIDDILRLLDEVPDAEWHLVGAENGANLLKHHKKFAEYRRKKRIVVHPVLDYPAFYKIAASASLFFQPPGFTGGGGGASIARNNGVPILCFRHSDVAPLQPQDFVFEEDCLTDGVNAALHILKSTEARDYLVGLQSEMMESRRAEAPQKFYDCLVETIAIYNRRLEARSPAESSA